MYRVRCLNPNGKGGHSKFCAYKQAPIHALADTETERAKAGSVVLDQCGKFDGEAAVVLVTQEKYYKVTEGIRQMGTDSSRKEYRQGPQNLLLRFGQKMKCEVGQSMRGCITAKPVSSKV